MHSLMGTLGCVAFQTSGFQATYSKRRAAKARLFPVFTSQPALRVAQNLKLALSD